MTRTAIIAGVGPGLSESIVRKFADEGCQVALFARSREYLEELVGRRTSGSSRPPSSASSPERIYSGKGVPRSRRIALS